MDLVIRESRFLANDDVASPLIVDPGQPRRPFSTVRLSSEDLIRTVNALRGDVSDAPETVKRLTLAIRLVESINAQPNTCEAPNGS